jgi:hypothetical protein
LKSSQYSTGAGKVNLLFVHIRYQGLCPKGIQYLLNDSLDTTVNLKQVVFLETNVNQQPFRLAFCLRDWIVKGGLHSEALRVFHVPEEFTFVPDEKPLRDIQNPQNDYFEEWQ